MCDDRYDEDLFGDAREHAVRSASTLTVSARLDEDGVAATRGAEDLVATSFTTGNDPTPVELTLKGRGFVSTLLKK